MTFNEAAKIANEGKKLSRKNWKGFWYLKEGKFFNKYWVMHLSEGKEISRNFTNATIFNCLASDWEVVPEDETQQAE